MNEVNYHTAPDLESEEIKALKKMAIDLGLTVKELVRRAIVRYLIQSQMEPIIKEEQT